MPVTQRTTTIYICDRCEFTSEDSYARGGYLELTGHKALRAYDGATGGGVVKVWMCGDCLRAFQEFMKVTNNKE
jgi:hypothetical protein